MLKEITKVAVTKDVQQAALFGQLALCGQLACNL
jgi:hypothetical protein